MANRPRAWGVTTSMPGRFIMGARTAQIVTDASPASGGAGEALVAQELYLVSLATCALAVIDGKARAQQLEALVHVDAETEIDPDDTTRYRSATMAFRFKGASQTQAEALVAAFTAVCPIYNTLARTTPVTIQVSLG